jgi:cytochrome P450
MLVFRAAPLWTLERLRARYGPRFTIRPFGMAPLVLLADPHEAGAVFAASADTLRPGEGAAAIEPIVGPSSFLLADGEAHRRARALLRDPFARATAQEHAALVRAVAEEEIAAWPRGQAIALHPLLRSLTLRVILRLAFGVEDRHLRELHARLLALLNVTASAVFTVPLQRRLPGGRRIWQRFLDDRGRADALIAGLVGWRRREGAGAGATTGEHATLLDLLLAARDDAGEPLSTAQIRDTLMSVVLAGHETTAAQLAWAFQLLAHHPDVQARLAQELAAPSSGQAYLAATIEEVLRHRPVFLFAIPRAVATPFELGDWTYRPPAQLVVCSYLIHHDATLHEQPHVFRPERFLGRASERASWLPWGGGRRRCPGRHLALVELETVLATALSALSVAPAAARMEHASWRSVIVAPHRGSRVVLRERTGVRCPERYCRPSRASRTSVTASGKTTAITLRI